MRHLLLSLLLACASSKNPAPAPHQKKIEVAKAKEMIGAGAIVIDVRTPEEFTAGHVDKATNLPVQSLEVSAVDKLTGGDHDKPVVVYCAAGARADKAQAQLEAAGYTHVVNGGGYDDLH